MREENMRIEKIQKSSKAALTITTIAKIFAITMAVILCLCGFLMIGLKGILNEAISYGIESGQLQPEEFSFAYEGMIGQKLIEEGYIAESAGAYMLAMGAMMICLAVVMHFIGKVFKEMKESYSPFRAEIVKSLKVSFVLITILSLKSSLLIGAVIGFSLWCVLNVFEYGCELQKQSDETL